MQVPPRERTGSSPVPGRYRGIVESVGSARAGAETGNRQSTSKRGLPMAKHHGKNAQIFMEEKTPSYPCGICRQPGAQFVDLVTGQNKCQKCFDATTLDTTGYEVKPRKEIGDGR